MHRMTKVLVIVGGVPPTFLQEVQPDPPLPNKIHNFVWYSQVVMERSDRSGLTDSMPLSDCVN